MLSTTHRQHKFVHQYIISGNAAEAARYAGYSPRSARQVGQRLLTKDDIQQLILQTQVEAQKRLAIERDDLVKGLMSAYSLAKQNADPTSMVSAMREIARLLGYYNNKTENLVNIDELSTARIQEMTEKELRQYSQEIDVSQMITAADDWVVSAKSCGF